MSERGGVAVIAVHGVGVHTPGDMARDVATLLQGANPGAYSPFACSDLEIRVERPLPTAGAARALTAQEDEAPAGKKPWYVRSEFVSRKVTRRVIATGAAMAAPPRAVPDDIRFTKQAVDGADIDAKLSVYRTVCLRGELAATKAASARTVDIYELSWSDLSHLGGFIGRVLSEFYQILFHVVALGQKTVELAWDRATGGEKWRLKYVLGVQTITEWLLAGAIPVLSLALLLAVLPLVPIVFLETNDARAAAVGVVCGVIVAALYLTQLWRSNLGTSRLAVATICASLLFAAVVGAITAYAALMVLTEWLDIGLYLLGSIGGFLVFVWLTRMLMRTRTESEELAPLCAGVIATVVWWTLLGYGLFASSPQGKLTLVTMRVGEGLFALLVVAWAAFYLFALLTCLFGAITSVLSESQRTRAAIWTGKIGIVVPATLFFTFNIFVWHFIAQFFIDHTDYANYESLFEWLMPSRPSENLPIWAVGLGCPGAKTTDACIAQLLAASTGAGFGAFLGLIVVSMALIVVAMLPSIVYEIRPTVGQDEEKSERLGRWLDNGIALSRFAGYIALFALLIALPGVELWSRYEGHVADTKLLDTLAALILGSAAIAIAFRKAVLGGLTKAVGIMLDVDNWLKERPLDRNPRGKILLRYMSLLRHVAARGYDHVVIVSHSQGTAISADLLRYLRAIPDTSLAAIKDIRLMTFGSPLHQLYGARFPHLYDWARGPAVTQNVPDPNALYSVKRWINGYRSGDYVGRFFWTATGQWVPSLPPNASGSGEFCLGFGAHTHYFDETALAVGRAIDQQIG